MGNAKELAEKEVEKKTAKAIAKRMMEVRRLNAKVKKLEKEITKIISGDLVPGEDDDEEDDSSDSGLTMDMDMFKKKVKDMNGPWGERNWKPAMGGVVHRPRPILYKSDKNG